MRLNIVHKSEYFYDSPVQYGLQRLRQTPKSRPGQTVSHWKVELEGAQEEVTYRDQYNNHVELISIIPGSERITITASGEVDTEETSGVVGPPRGYTPLWLFKRETPLTHKTRDIIALAREAKGDDDVALMHDLLDRIRERVPYVIGVTDANTTADEALALGKGVCQDHSHIFVTAARVRGYPARYVSGFLLIDGQDHQAASHAWAEVYIEGLGWVGYDVSNGISPDERYVCVATGLDYRDAAPISGIRHGTAAETLAVSLIVEQ